MATTKTRVIWGPPSTVAEAMPPCAQPSRSAAACALRRRGAGAWRTALAGACAYVGVEGATGKLFADTLGHGLYASVWMRQAADVAGAAGLTLVLLLANECVLAMVRGASWRRAIGPATCLGALASALLVYGAMRCRQLEGIAD